MKAFILAAGRGERMRPLTDHTPKPLLSAGGKPLIVWHLERLAAAGFKEVVINHAHLGEQIEAALGDGSRWGLHIHYSPEPPGALETAGGIAQALPLLGKEIFLLVNGDVYCAVDFASFQRSTATMAPNGAHLLMVANPLHHSGGDFSLTAGRVVFAQTEQTFTYSGVALFAPAFFAGVAKGTVMKLRPLLDAAIAEGTLSGERYDGRWVDVGTPQRLSELDAELRLSN